MGACSIPGNRPGASLGLDLTLLRRYTVAMKIHTIDLHFQNTPGIIAAFLVELGSELALIETGPGSTLETLHKGIQNLGFDPASLRHVFVSHIHLDHAGAAGWFSQQGAQIYCHPNAARHLINPAKLIDSARLVYGDAMDTLWGDMLPAPAEHVTILQDGETVSIGGHQVKAWDTPGHARHHHAYSIGTQCFTGDVAGMRLEASPYISVTAAPPQFDPVAYRASVERLLAASFTHLHLTHFGTVTDVEPHLTTYQQRIEDVHQNVRRWAGEGCDAQEIQNRYEAAEHTVAITSGLPESLWQRYQAGNHTAMCADGVRLYVERSPAA